MTELSKHVFKKCRLFSQNSLHICYYPDLSSSLLLLVLQFQKFREIVFVIQVLFSSCYHVQKQHVPFAVPEKKENLFAVCIGAGIFFTDSDRGSS